MSMLHSARSAFRTRFALALAGIAVLTSFARAAGGGDDCSAPDAVTGFGPFTYTLVGATDSPEQSFSCNVQIVKDVWFTWTATHTGWTSVTSSGSNGLPVVLRIYDGVGCPTSPDLLSCGWVHFFAVTGLSYTVRIGVPAQHGPQSGTFTFVDASPSEDSCATPAAFLGNLGAVHPMFATTGLEGQNEFACTGPGGTAIQEDCWLLWTATFSGNAALIGCGTGYVTTGGNRKAAVFAGSGCPTSAPIGCDDDSCGLGQPRVPFVAVTGQDYLVQVGRSPADTSGQGMSGTWVIVSTDPVPNDECTSPLVLVGEGPFEFDLSVATTSATPFACDTMSKDLWYVWVAPATGTATFDACGTNGDTALEVYASSTCPMGGAIACGDEGCSVYGPTVQDFPVQCGVAYLLRWGMYGTTTSGAIRNFRLSVVGTTCGTFTTFCAGDSASACPCGNAGSPSRGCASSFLSSGAALSANGNASLSVDSVALEISGASPSFVTLFQGTTQIAAGSGVAFGDGLRCAGGSTRRLVTRLAPGGQLRFPQASDPVLSVLGQVPGATTRTYQGWYRDSTIGFCSASTFNLTNGVQVVWTP